MITSFEVGAVFKILDEASPALRKVLAQVRALNEAIDKAKLNISGLLTSLGAGLDPAIAQTRTLAVEWRSVSRAAQGARRSLTSLAAAGREAAVISLPTIPAVPHVALPGRGAGGAPGGHGGGNGGRGIFGYRASGFGVPGGHLHVHGSTVALASAGTLTYGAVLAAEQQDAIWQMIYQAGVADSAANRSKFAGILQTAHSLTAMPLPDLYAAAIDEIRMFRGTKGKGITVLPEMLRAAATEARAKGHGTTVDEAMQSLVGLAHMTKEYSASDIVKLAPAFAFLSSSTGATLQQIERAAGYAVPILQSGLKIDPMQTMLMGIVMQRAGITNTKSGTWLRNMMLNALPGTSLMSKTAFKHHEQALTDLGLIDQHNKPTWFTNGLPDVFKFMEIASAHAQGLSLTRRVADENALFGKQGFGAFAILSDPKVWAQLEVLKAQMPGYDARYATFWQAYNSQSTAQTARKSLADFQNVLTDIGNNVLPPVNKALGDLDSVLKTIQKHLPGIPSNSTAWATVGGRALEGMAVGAIAGSFVPGVGTVIGGGLGTLVGGAEGYMEALRDSKTQTQQYGVAVQQSGTAASSAAASVAQFTNALNGIATGLPLVGKPGSLLQKEMFVPSHGGGGIVHHTSIYLDRRQVGDAVTEIIADRGTHALEGSAYHDGTWSAAPSDMAYSI